MRKGSHSPRIRSRAHTRTFYSTQVRQQQAALDAKHGKGNNTYYDEDSDDDNDNAATVRIEFKQQPQQQRRK